MHRPKVGTLRSLEIPDGILRLGSLFDETVAQELLVGIHNELVWEQHHLKIFGRVIPSPRRTAWMGDPHAIYRYSGQTLRPVPWSPTVATVRQAVQRATGETFNSVLLNLYRDGQDSMGWHSDDERDLGTAPWIASVSLGATRRFLLKHRTEADQRLSLDLESGSLLVMGGPMQRHWKHAVPKTKREVGPRVNLTFRHVVTDATGSP